MEGVRQKSKLFLDDCVCQVYNQMVDVASILVSDVYDISYIPHRGKPQLVGAQTTEKSV